MLRTGSLSEWGWWPCLGDSGSKLVTSRKDLARMRGNAFTVPAQACCFLLLLLWDVNHRNNGFWSIDARRLHSFSEEAFLPEGSLLALWHGVLRVCQCHFPPWARSLEEVDPGVQDMRSRLGERAGTCRKELLKWEESLRRAKETRAFCPERQLQIKFVISFRYRTRGSTPISRPVLPLSLVTPGRSFIHSKYNMRSLNQMTFWKEHKVWSLSSNPDSATYWFATLALVFSSANGHNDSDIMLFMADKISVSFNKNLALSRNSEHNSKQKGQKSFKLS